MGMLSEALGLLRSAASSPTPEPRNNNPNNFDSETLFKFYMQQDATI